MTRNAVVLFSGGLDSTTVLAIAKYQGFQLFPLTIDYGQRHYAELLAAERIARTYEAVLHKIIKIDLRAIGGSALTDQIDVPKNALSEKIPATYVPARNTIFLSLALAYAEVNQAHDIFLGANVIDYSNYPDCRPEYLEAFEEMASLATKSGVQGHRVRIHAPLLQLSKAEIIHKGTQLLVDYSQTHSCYDPKGELACGHCDSCLLRKKGFWEAGIKDPTRYAEFS